MDLDLTKMEEKELRVYRESGYLVNVKNLTEEQIEYAQSKFLYRFYDDGACNKCPYKEDRHGEQCDPCASYKGARQLAKVVDRGNERLLSMPYGATTKVRSFLKRVGRPFKVVDRHPEPTPFRRSIRLLPHVKLRDYQLEAVEAIVEQKKGIIQSPPRSGKTLIFAAAVCQIGFKTIIMASQRDWLNQFRETFIGSDTMKPFTNCRPAQINFCKTYEDFLKVDIALVTPQQFMSPKGRLLLEKIRSLFCVLGIDECHFMPALQTSRVLATWNATYRIGLTGTPARKQENLFNVVHDLLGPIIYKSQVERSVPRVEVLSTEMKFEIKNKGSQAAFSNFVNKVEYSKSRLNLIADRAIREVRNGHMVIVPLLRTKAILALVRIINEKTESKMAAPFYGQMDKRKRPETIERARNYEIKILVGNTKLVSTGLNIPRASCLIECTVSSNLPNCEQRTSRILTPMDDKPQPLIIYVLDDSDLLRATRKVEWWGLVHPKFRPEIAGPTRQLFYQWLSGKSAANLEGKMEL